MRVSDYYADVSPINKQRNAAKLTKIFMNVSCSPGCSDNTATFLVSATVQFVALCAVRLNHVTSRYSW
jgi:hypothetical protein